MSGRSVRRINVSQKSLIDDTMRTVFIPDANLPITISQKLHNDLFVESNMGIIKAPEDLNEKKEKDDVFGDFYVATKHGMDTYRGQHQRGCCSISTPPGATPGNKCCGVTYRLFSFLPQLPCVAIQGFRSLIGSRSYDSNDIESKDRNAKDPWNTMLIEEFTKFWLGGDIGEKDKDAYKEAVQKAFSDWQTSGDLNALQDVQAEVEQIAINGYLNRMQVCLELLDFTKPSASKYIFATTVMSCLYCNEEIAIAVAEAAAQNAALIMEDGPYKGTTPLHFAICNNSKRLLEIILANMSQEQKDTLFHNTIFGDTISNKMPYIEKMLNLAVYEAGPEIIALLVEEGAEMHLQDSHGYNPFHICCILATQQPDRAVLAFDALMGSIDQWLLHTKAFESLRDEDQVHAKELLLYKLFKTEDNEGLTPIKLAARYGQKALIEKMLNIVNIYKFPHARVGSLTKAYYDVSEIDPVLSHDTSKPSVLELLIMTESSSDEDNNQNFLQCLSIPIINRLVDQKWQLVMPFFTFWCIWHLILLSFSSFYAVAYLFPKFQYLNVSSDGTTTHDVGRFTLDLMDVPLLVNTGLYLLYYIAISIVVILIQRRVKIYSLKQILSGLSVMEIKLMGPYIIMTMLYFLFRLIGSDFDTIAMGFSLFLGWLGVMFFTRAFQASGIFTIIISEVLYKDLIRFLFVILLIDVGFSLAVLSIQASALSASESLPSVGSVFLNFFKLALTINDYAGISESDAPVALLILYLTYLLACSLLLLNMMIGAMSETYAFLSNDGENTWKRVRTRDAIVMEWTLPRCIQLYVSSIQEHRIVRTHLKDGAIIERHFYLACTKFQDGGLDQKD